MLQEISQEIKETLNNFPEEDKIIFNNKPINIDKNNFQPILKTKENKTIAFIDGGQAEIISAGNFCLSFIRIFAQTFNNNKKTDSVKTEFYLFTKAKYADGDIYYESKLFPLKEKLINEEDLFISSNDTTIKTGTERAPISKISNIARRFAELTLAINIKADFIILDGTLEPTFKNEEKYFNKIGPQDCWSYFVDNKTHFVKLHEKAKHIFRFEGNKDVLPLLIQNSCDPLFLGYPYGLIFADKFARISNTEKNSLKTKFLLQKENKEILNYLTSTNAHDILDSIS